MKKLICSLCLSAFMFGIAPLAFANTTYILIYCANYVGEEWVLETQVFGAGDTNAATEAYFACANGGGVVKKVVVKK